MAYAIDRKRNVLIQAQVKEIDARNELLPVGGAFAHNWVKCGNPHETTLFVGEGGRVKRAGK